jgi:hypothetical protein
VARSQVGIVVKAKRIDNETHEQENTIFVRVVRVFRGSLLRMFRLKRIRLGGCKILESKRNEVGRPLAPLVDNQSPGLPVPDDNPN